MLLLTILLSIHFNFSFQSGGKLLSMFRSRRCQGDEECHLIDEKDEPIGLDESDFDLVIPSTSGIDSQNKYTHDDIDFKVLAINHYSLVKCTEDNEHDTLCVSINRMLHYVPFFNSRFGNTEVGNIFDSIRQSLAYYLRFKTRSMLEGDKLVYFDRFKMKFESLLKKSSKKCFPRKELDQDQLSERILTKFIKFLKDLKPLWNIIIKLISNLHPKSKLLEGIPKNVMVDSIQRELIFIFTYSYGSRIIAEVIRIFDTNPKQYAILISEYHSSLFDLRSHFDFLRELLPASIDRVTVILIYLYNKPGFNNIQNVLATLIREIKIRHKTDLYRLKTKMESSYDKYYDYHEEFYDTFRTYYLNH